MGCCLQPGLWQRPRHAAPAMRLVGLVSLAALLAALVAAPVAALDAEEQMLADIYRRVHPAVVNVSRQTGAASGFVYDSAGHIVTSHHVVGDAAEVEVVFADGTTATARVLGRDPDTDLAVLKVEQLPPPEAGVHPVELGDSDMLVVGQRAIAIGNPFGLSGSMTVGIVSALGRVIPSGASPFSIPDVIQTDTVINPGNSGGPLLDSSGRVIGVNTAIRSMTGLFAGVGFAVPVNLVKRVVPALVATGTYTWPWLGVSGVDVDAFLARANRLAVSQGAYIHQVFAGGPADRAGLRATQRTEELDGRQVPVGGDVVVAIEETPVRRFDDLLRYVIRQGAVGQSVRLSVLRDGSRLTVAVTLEARPRSFPEEAPATPPPQP